MGPMRLALISNAADQDTWRSDRLMGCIPSGRLVGLTCWKQDRAAYWTSARAGVVAGLQITAPSGCAMFLLSIGARKVGKV